MHVDPAQFTDAQLMLLYQHGRESAFEELYRRRVDGLIAYLERLTGSRPIAEELAQDSFVRAARAAAKWEPQAAFTTWLYRIASNRYLSWRERRGPVLVPFPADLPSCESGPLEQVMARRGQAELLRHVAALPPALAAAFTLVKLQGTSLAEAAEILELPLGTVKTHVSRARERIRRRMAAHPATPLRRRDGEESPCPR